MCTRYVSPSAAAIERQWHVGRHNPWRGGRPEDGPLEVFPSYLAPIIRAARDTSEPERQIVLSQWNLIPWFANSPKLKYATCNARSEELTSKASYKEPWSRGQRCIIPAVEFFEPNWESGRHVPWRFRRLDGEPWGLAGIWSTWADKGTGEVHESFTMLTICADSHPLLSRMHRPDKNRAPDMQDKRSVCPIDLADVDSWLYGPTEEAASLLRLPPIEVLDAAEGMPPPRTTLERRPVPVQPAQAELL